MTQIGSQYEYEQAEIPLTYNSQTREWSGSTRVVFLTTNASEGLLIVFDNANRTAGMVVSIPYTLAVEDESVTYSIVSNSTTIFLTIVIITFILLDFREKDGEDKQKEKDESYFTRGRYN